MAINKVILGDKVMVDLSHDTVSKDDVMKNVTFHLPSGESETGNAIRADNIDFYKFQDEQKNISNGDILATDEEYEAAEIYLQKIYSYVSGEDLI